MNKTLHVSGRPARLATERELQRWHIAQALFLLAGGGIFLSLLFFPQTGIQLFWNVLIPLAPALFVVATGVWRNICPLGIFSLLPHHFDLSKKRRLSVAWQGRLSLAGVALLFLIVPLRHLVFDTSGPATAALLAGAAAAAFAAGIAFEWKSGWCSGICPVHPVERLYGEKVAYTPPNAHCTQCANCVIPCPDSTPASRPTETARRSLHRISACLLTGGLPGLVWGWFHVPDHAGAFGWSDVLAAFAWPWGSALFSLGLFLCGRHFLQKKQHATWSGLFAAAAVACYYWYRLPALIGFGLFPGDGMLVDLHGAVPAWSVAAVQVLAVAFFGWWLLLRKPRAAAEWAVRPPFAVKQKAAEFSKKK